MELIRIISIIAVSAGVLSALIILIDVIRHPQEMPIMNIVWPINGLYLGPFAIWFYWKLGKKGMHDKKPFWQSVFVSASHCSGGCTAGDAIGVPIVFFTGLTVAGSALYAHYAVEFILAYIFGLFFQVFSIVPMKKKMGENISWLKGFGEAAKADTLSLIAFEVGMFGWMAIVHFLLFSNPPSPDTFVYWFMMQIAMILGLATSYPANWLLVKRGVKHGM